MEGEAGAACALWRMDPLPVSSVCTPGLPVPIFHFCRPAINAMSLLLCVVARISMPVLVILEAQLLSMERRAALLWRADRAGVLVALVVPYLSPDDTRLQLKSLTFVATIIQCLPSEALFISALKSIPKEGDRHQYVVHRAGVVPSGLPCTPPTLCVLWCVCVRVCFAGES